MGIWIDDKLKFTSHIGHAVADSNQILGLIKRSFVYRDTDIIKRLFTALVRPHLCGILDSRKMWNDLKKFTDVLLN